MSHPINNQILEQILEQIQDNYPNLSEKEQQELAYKTFEEQAQWLKKLLLPYSLR